jgi:hypothetical protein
MADAPAWKPDPERDDQERYWSGSAWTDRVRPAGKAGSLHVPEHVPHLHRALSAATADIDAVEDRLSVLFERTDGARAGGSAASASVSPAASAVSRAEPVVDDDEVLDLYGDEDENEVVDEGQGATHDEFAGRTDAGGASDTDVDEDGAFAELDAALAAEEPDEPEQARPQRKLFRRRR